MALPGRPESGVAGFAAQSLIAGCVCEAELCGIVFQTEWIQLDKVPGITDKPWKEPITAAKHLQDIFGPELVYIK